MNGDFPLVAKNEVTKVLEIVPFEEQTDELKKKLAKNNKVKMVIANFARFNTIISSLKALDEGFSSKNYVRKFLRDLHPKWRAKVTAIEESKDLSSLALDELIGNLKSSDDETSTSESDDEEYAMAVRNFKKFFRRKGRFVRQPREEKKSFRQRDDKKSKSDRKCFRCGDPNHLIGECPKPPRNKDQKAFVGGCWSDSENEVDDKTNDVTCLMAQSSNEVTLDSSHYSDDASSFDDDITPSCKIGLGFDKSKVSTSGTKPISFVGSTIELEGDESTIKADGSTVPGSVDPSTSQKWHEQFLSPPLSRDQISILFRKETNT
ncbi:zf-CCHC domain-containing protein [Tanacetum coccineum]